MRFPLCTVDHPSSPSNDNLATLMGAYYTPLHRSFAHRFRNQPHPILDADDIVGQAFTSLWQGLSDNRFTITSDTDVHYILRMLATRHWSDAQKYRCASLRSSLRTQAMDDATADGIIGGDADPSSTLCAADMLSVLLSRLSPLDRQILSYRLDGWDQYETAEVLGISQSYVSIRSSAIKMVMQAMNVQ